MRVKPFALVAALSLTPLSASTAVLAAAGSGVFDMEQARAFCAVEDAKKAERCLADQQSAGAWLDAWTNTGEFPRFMAERIVARCNTRYRPDMRQVKLCVEEVRDNRGKSGRRAL